jgi:hypothetical protein
MICPLGKEKQARGIEEFEKLLKGEATIDNFFITSMLHINSCNACRERVKIILKK